MSSPYEEFEGKGRDVIEALAYGHERTIRRCIDGISKHGVYDPLSIEERIAKIIRHAEKYRAGSRDEDHLAAIAASAEFAMTEELRLADIEDDRP